MSKEVFNTALIEVRTIRRPEFTRIEPKTIADSNPNPCAPEEATWIEPKTIADSYPSFCTPEMSKMYQGIASREKLAITTLLQKGYQMAKFRAEWMPDEGKLKLTDEEGKIRVLNEAQISLYEKKTKEELKRKEGMRKDDKSVFDSLGHYKAFSDWIEQDERSIIFKILALEACGFGGVPQEEDPFVKDLEQSLSDPNSALQRGKEKIITLFNLKIDEEDPAKSDAFAETVLEVLYSSP